MPFLGVVAAAVIKVTVGVIVIIKLQNRLGTPTLSWNSSRGMRGTFLALAIVSTVSCTSTHNEGMGLRPLVNIVLSPTMPNRTNRF